MQNDLPIYTAMTSSQSLVMQSNTLCGVYATRGNGKATQTYHFCWEADTLLFSLGALPPAPPALLKMLPWLSVSSQFYALTEERLLSLAHILLSLRREKRCWKLLFFIYVEQAEFISSQRGLCALCFDGAARSFADEAMTLEIFIEKWTLFLHAPLCEQKGDG